MGILATPQAISEKFQTDVYTGSGASARPTDKVTPVTYWRDTNEKWIYCNYPEGIGVGEGLEPALGDNGYCINQQTVSGVFEIFFSHGAINNTRNYTYGIQIYNPNAQSVKVSKLNEGFCNGWDAALPWKNFFSSQRIDYNEIASGGNVWIFEEAITGSAFSGMIRMQSDAPVIVTVYAYLNKGALQGTEKPYPYENTDTAKLKQYSGVGNGFYNQLSMTLTASELENPKYYWNNHPSTPNTNEMIPILLVGTTLIAGPGQPSPRHNVGNWCAHYFNAITLVNDSNTRKKFQAFFGGPLEGGITGIIHGTNGVVSMCADANGEYKNGQCWKWFEQELEPNETYQFNYEYILGTNSGGPACFMWKAV